MTRRLFNILTVLSLLLLVAVAVLWVRSHQFGDDVGYSRGAHRYYIRTGGGEIALEISRYHTERFPSQFAWDTDPARTRQLYGMPRDTLFKRLGFYSRTALMDMGGSSGIVGTNHAWMVPMWFAALLAALVPALHLPAALRRVRRRRRAESRRCPACGYDLRATPGQCPECGTLASVSPSA